MNKSIIVGVILGLTVPFLSLGITPTREALLGLAPDEQILSLADQIDSSRVENVGKLAELQSTIDAQQDKLAEQQELIDEQKAEVATVSMIVVKNRDCSVDIAKYCIETWQSDTIKFDKLVAHAVESCLENEDWSRSKCENFVDDQYTDKFNLCQTAMSCQ